MKLYPLQFEPILKERIWGGAKLGSLLNKQIVSDRTGESWEISAVEGNVSVVSNGALAGKSLNDLMDSFPEAILGNEVYKKFGKQFPLLFKYLDARGDLSIQVHPNDELAKKRHNSFGKTEMWYVMQADENARIIAGFKKNSNSDEFLENLENKTLLSLLDIEKVKTGDAFFLETGTVHAIGAGLVVAEIQQTSDITYRLYDFDRVDAQGNKRELHLDLAQEAINYNIVETRKIYDTTLNKPNPIVDCPYFTTNFIPLEGKLAFNKSGNSFTVFMCIDGNFEIEYDDTKFQFTKGETVFIPAALKAFILKGKASILEIYIS